VNLAMKEVHPDVVFVDVVGIGAGVVDRLRQLGKDNIIEVNFGEKATEDTIYFNKRTECWSQMRDWLPMADIPFDKYFKADLTGPEYGFDARERLQLEKKKDMKSRGLDSPDRGDACAVTFAEKIMRMPDEEDLIPDYLEDD